MFLFYFLQCPIDLASGKFFGACNSPAAGTCFYRTTHHHSVDIQHEPVHLQRFSCKPLIPLVTIYLPSSSGTSSDDKYIEANIFSKWATIKKQNGVGDLKNGDVPDNFMTCRPHFFLVRHFLHLDTYNKQENLTKKNSKNPPPSLNKREFRAVGKRNSGLVAGSNCTRISRT